MESSERSSENREKKECIEHGFTEPVERVVTRFGGVAPVCDEHAEERLGEDPAVVDQTAYFKGEREKPKPEPEPSDFRRRSL